MDNGTNVAREMPRYISCKLVWAVCIAAIEQAPADQEKQHPSGDWYIKPAEDGYGPICVSHDFVAKHKPAVGGYYIRYQDGYESYSPSAAFLRGATPEAEWGIPRTQETKYGVNLRGKLFNRATGREVDEPIFVLRAQDRRALPFIVDYRQLVGDGDRATQDALDLVILNFSTFGHQQPQRMKDGDSKAPPPPVPYSMNSNPQRWQTGEREG